MPVQFYNLGFNLYHAENAQAAQTLFNMQDRGGHEIAAARSRDVGKEEGSTVVQTTNEVKHEEGSPDNTGAHSHTLTKQEKEKEEEKQEAKSPPDPTGRGQILDMKV